MLILILLWLAIWPAQSPILPVTDLPLGQVVINEIRPVYDFPNPSEDAQARSRVRPRDVRLIYQIEGEWGRINGGWIDLTELALQPAVVQYSALSAADEAIPISSTIDEPPNDLIPPDDVIGVVAIFEGRALLYTAERVGWADLSALTIIPPQPDLIDFGEVAAYVQVERAALLAQPDLASEELAEVALGRRVSVLHQNQSQYQNEEWALIRDDVAYGWTQAANLDLLIVAQLRGEMRASPVNFRASPPDGRVLTVLEYGQSLLIYGRDRGGTWLCGRLANGLSGWVAAEFVTLDGVADDLPIIREEQDSCGF